MALSLVKTLSSFDENMQLAYYIAKSQPELLNPKTSLSIDIPSLGCRMSQPITFDNSKLIGTGVFDTMAGPRSCGGTCLNCHTCFNAGCYANRDQNLRPTVLLKRRINTYLAMHDLEWLKIKIIEQLESRPDIEIIRIHSSGDFFSQRYVDTWREIAKHFPDKFFYFYTKVEHLFNFHDFIALDNVNRVKSILPDGQINYGDPEWVYRMEDKYPMIETCHYHDPRFMHFDAEKGKRVFDEIHCGAGHCTKCLFNEYMLFFKH
jgi:hypothetical protein